MENQGIRPKRQRLSHGGQVVGWTMRRADVSRPGRTSGLPILYFSVLSGIARDSAVSVTFHPAFFERSNNEVARERIRRVVEKTVGPSSLGFQRREMKFERQ